MVESVQDYAILLLDPGGLLEEDDVDTAQRLILICLPPDGSTQRVGLVVRAVLGKGEAEYLPVKTIAGNAVARVDGKLTAMVQTSGRTRVAPRVVPLKEVA